MNETREFEPESVEGSHAVTHATYDSSAPPRRR